MNPTQKPDLSTNLCGVPMPNPTVVASGILGLSHEVMVRVARCGAGAVTPEDTRGTILPIERARHDFRRHHQNFLKCFIFQILFGDI